MAEVSEGYTVVMPKLGLIMTEALLVEWRRKDGEWIEKGEVLFTLESDKSTLEIEAPASGYVHTLVPEGEVVPVQTPIAIIQPKLTDQVSLPLSVKENTTEREIERLQIRDKIANEERGTAVSASPRARIIARQLGISLLGIKGSGPRGMVVAADLAHINRLRNRFMRLLSNLKPVWL